MSFAEATARNRESHARDLLETAIRETREACDQAERRLRTAETPGQAARGVLGALSAGSANAIVSVQGALSAIEDAAAARAVKP